MSVSTESVMEYNEDDKMESKDNYDSTNFTDTEDEESNENFRAGRSKRGDFMPAKEVLLQVPRIFKYNERRRGPSAGESEEEGNRARSMDAKRESEDGASSPEGTTSPGSQRVVTDRTVVQPASKSKHGSRSQQMGKESSKRGGEMKLSPEQSAPTHLKATAVSNQRSGVVENRRTKSKVKDSGGKGGAKPKGAKESRRKSAARGGRKSRATSKSGKTGSRSKSRRSRSKRAKSKSAKGKSTSRAGKGVHSSSKGTKGTKTSDVKKRSSSKKPVGHTGQTPPAKSSRGGSTSKAKTKSKRDKRSLSKARGGKSVRSRSSKKGVMTVHKKETALRRKQLAEARAKRGGGRGSVSEAKKKPQTSEKRSSVTPKNRSTTTNYSRPKSSQKVEQTRESSRKTVSPPVEQPVPRRGRSGSDCENSKDEYTDETDNEGSLPMFDQELSDNAYQTDRKKEVSWDTSDNFFSEDSEEVSGDGDEGNYSMSAGESRSSTPTTNSDMSRDERELRSLRETLSSDDGLWSFF